MATFQELLSQQKYADIITHHLQHRVNHWTQLVRLVMSVQESHVEQHDIQWGKITPRDLDTPITREALSLWLQGAPPSRAVAWLRTLFEVRDPRDVTIEELLQLVAETAPRYLVEVSPGWIAYDPKQQELSKMSGVKLGEACALHKSKNPGSLYDTTLQYATHEAMGAYLRDAAALVDASEVTRLGDWLAPHATSLASWIKEAYAKALLASAAKEKKPVSYRLYVQTKLLDQANSEELFKLTAKKPEVFQMVAAQAASQGQPHSADALVALLDDKKVGRVAALALASMGAEGSRAAAGYTSPAKGKPKPGAALANILKTLPAPPTTLWAGEQYSLPRFGRDSMQDLLVGLPIAAPTLPATPLEKIEEAIKQKPSASLLPPEGWADLLQLLALDPQLSNVPYAYERAKARGRLGCGADAGAMCAALDSLSWGCTITKHYPASDWGVGFVLVWAKASREVFLHAIARFEMTSAPRTMGMINNHFEKILAAAKPSWAKEVAVLLRHIGADRNETIHLGPPKKLASIAGEASSLELPSPALNLWIRAHVQEASRFTIRFRESVALTVDVDAQEWSLNTPKKQGSTPPLSGRGVSLVLEMARGNMYIGLNGVAVTGGLSGLPLTNGPVKIEAEGSNAKVTSLELFEKFSVSGVDAASRLLLDLKSKQAYTEIAGQESPAAAHLLAAASLILEEEQATLAATALSSMKGKDLGPWQASTRASTTAAEAPTAFEVRSFEDVVKDFEALKLGVKPRAKKPLTLSRGTHRSYQYASFSPKPQEEEWGSKDAVKYPAVYLSQEEPDVKKLEYFIEQLSGLPALSMKGRGTSAKASYVLKQDSYIVADLTLFPPEDSGDWGPFMGSATGAAWKVREGWAYAMLSNREALAKLMGMGALPPALEWKSAEKLTVGDW